MKYRVLVTPTADAEAMAAFRWYAERSVTAAERWYAGLNRAMARLADNPARHAISEDDSEALGARRGCSSTAAAVAFTASSTRSAARPPGFSEFVTGPRDLLSRNRSVEPSRPDRSMVRALAPPVTAPTGLSRAARRRPPRASCSRPAPTRGASPARPHRGGRRDRRRPSSVREFSG